MWVYSGRRGIHCWISDTAALNLTDEQRKGIVGYLEVIKGGASQQKKVDLVRPLHPSLDRCVETLLLPFNSVILIDQDCFRSVTGWQTLLALLPTNEPALAKWSDTLTNEWRNGPELSSRERWQMLADVGRELVEGTSGLKVSSPIIK